MGWVCYIKSMGSAMMDLIIDILQAQKKKVQQRENTIKEYPQLN